jgi:hypothetical protein
LKARNESLFVLCVPAYEHSNHVTCLLFLMEADPLPSRYLAWNEYWTIDNFARRSAHEVSYGAVLGGVSVFAFGAVRKPLARMRRKTGIKK